MKMHALAIRERPPISCTKSLTRASPVPATYALHLVLCFRLCGRLPLHVARRVRASARERHLVVDDVARPTTRKPRLFLKRALGFIATRDLALAGSLQRARGRRRGGFRRPRC